MLTHQSAVIELEGSAFIVKEVSVRGADYQDTLLFKPPYPLHLVRPRARRIYAWNIENLHGLSRDSGFYD